MHLHHPAQGPYRVPGFMDLDERVPPPDTLARYAAASLGMSRSSVTCLSSAFNGRCSALKPCASTRSASGLPYTFPHLYKLYGDTPIRRATSLTG